MSKNSPIYSYGGIIDTSAEPNLIGGQVLEIWNERVTSIREKYKNLRTVVLVKSNDLSHSQFLNLTLFVMTLNYLNFPGIKTATWKGMLEELTINSLFGSHMDLNSQSSKKYPKVV